MPLVAKGSLLLPTFARALATPFALRFPSNSTIYRRTMSTDLLSRLEKLQINLPASAVVQHGPVSGSKAWKEALDGKDGVPAQCESSSPLSLAWLDTFPGVARCSIVHSIGHHSTLL